MAKLEKKEYRNDASSSSDFLKHVETSARNILRKNNAIRTKEQANVMSDDYDDASTRPFSMDVEEPRPPTSIRKSISKTTTRTTITPNKNSSKASSCNTLYDSPLGKLDKSKSMPNKQTPTSHRHSHAPSLTCTPSKKKKTTALKERKAYPASKQSKSGKSKAVALAYSSTKKKPTTANRSDPNIAINDPNYLRRRFRCDQPYDDDDDSNKNDIDQDGHPVDANSNRIGSKGCSNEAKKNNSSPSSPSLPEPLPPLDEKPIPKLIAKHVNIITERFNAMTKRNLSTYSSDIYNGHRETLEMEARLGSLNASVTIDAKTKRTDGQVQEEEEKEDRRYEQKATLDVPSIDVLQNESRCGEQIHIPSHDSSQERTKVKPFFGDRTKNSTIESKTPKSDRIIPTLPIECWSLVVLEHIATLNSSSTDKFSSDNGNSFPVDPSQGLGQDQECGAISMRLMKGREKKLNGNGVIRDGNDVDGDNSDDDLWIFDFYSSTYHHQWKCVLKEHEVSSLLTLINDDVGDKMIDESNTNKRMNMVYETKVKRFVEGVEYEGTGRITVHVDKGKMHANISLQLHLPLAKEQEIKEVEQVMMEFNISLQVYEIIAGLGLHHLCKMHDVDFWLSDCRKESEFVWVPLLNAMMIVRENESGGDLYLQPSWVDGGDEIVWSQPCTKMECIAYRTALAKAHVILHSLSLNMNELDRHPTMEFLQQATFRDKSRLTSILEMEETHKITNQPPLSLRTTNDLALSDTLMPGSSVVGSVGPWVTEENGQGEEYDVGDLDIIDDTQVAMSLNRIKPKAKTKKKSNEPEISGGTVTVRVALQTPIPSGTFNVFDSKPMLPEKAVDKPVSGPIPNIMAESKAIYSEPLVSKLDSRLPPPVVLVDPRSLSLAEKEEMKKFPPASDFDENNLSFNENGYRLRELAHDVNFGSEFSLYKFGITENGISPNERGVNKRTIWHSEETCTDLLSKPRGSGDFLSMVQNKFSGKNGGSPNDPLISTIYTKAYKTKEVKGEKLLKRKENDAKKARDAEVLRKKEILEMKIEAADVILEKRLSETGMVFEDFDKCELRKKKESIIADSSQNEMDALNHHHKPGPLRGYEWRELPDKVIGVNFFKLKNCKVRGYEKCNLIDRCNKPQMIGIIEPSKAIDYKSQESKFQTSMQTEFIDDLLEDRFQLSHKKMQEAQSRDILLNSEQQHALDHIMNVPLQRIKKDKGESVVPAEVRGSTDVNNVLNISVGSSAIDNNDDAAKIENAIQSTRHGNIALLEELLDDLGVEADTKDEFGNTLLILAGQQGNKKLCKFLLRRGSYINAQNHSGNTILHYLHEYGHDDLAKYMMRKGADDSYLNAQGMTCYEGVNVSNINL